MLRQSPVNIRIFNDNFGNFKILKKIQNAKNPVKSRDFGPSKITGFQNVASTRWKNDLWHVQMPSYFIISASFSLFFSAIARSNIAFCHLRRITSCDSAVAFLVNVLEIICFIIYYSPFLKFYKVYFKISLYFILINL